MRTDDELIDVVRSGDHSAFAELVRRHERAAASTAWRVLGDYHAAQDATQNAFVEAFRQLHQLRKSQYFGAWVMQITRREALRIAGRNGREMPLEAASEIGAPDVPNTQTDRRKELLAAIGNLPDQERIVVGLRYLDGRSVAEIARMTVRPVGTVTKQLSRAIDRLKSLLREVHS